MPDFASILGHSAVRREARAPCSIVDRDASPAIIAGPCLGGAPLGGAIWSEIGAVLILIGAPYRIDDGSITIPRCELRDDSLEVMPRDSMAEKKNVIAAYFFADLDVRAVVSADNHGAVHHGLHTASPRGLGARGGNLFGDLGCGEQQLGR